MNETVDNKNLVAKVFDVVINPSVYQKLFVKEQAKQFEPETMGFFAELLFNYAFQKFKLLLQKNFVCLKSCSYKGEFVKYQRVKAKAKPNIQVVNREEESISSGLEHLKKLNGNIGQNGVNRTMRPDWKLFVLFDEEESEEFDGFNFDNETAGLAIHISLPLLETGNLTSTPFIRQHH